MYPTRNQYKNAILNEMYPILENGGYSFTPVFRNNELVLAAGANATVFKLQNSAGDNKAVKLFTDEIAQRFQRFEKISSFLRHNNFPYFIDFTFVKNLIYVPIDGQEENENFFPGLIMKWIEAPTLETKLKYLIDNNDTNSISVIATNFKNMAISLLENKIGHGDLKASNILVDDQLALYLIDYDGMYISNFSGLKSFELGTPSYQHLKRTESDFNEKIDHFSILVIYTSLIALAKRPDLYDKFTDGDNIIFKKEDFQDPGTSELFTILSTGRSTFELTYFIKKSAESESIYIDNIIDLLNGVFPQPIIKFFRSDKEVIFDTQKFTLSWESENAERAEIEGIGNVEVNGSLQISVVGQSYFKLIMYNLFGKAIQELTVTRFPIPLIESLKVAAPIFESRLTLNPITIQSPNINVSINFESYKLSQLPHSFINLHDDLRTTKPIYKRESPFWSISTVFNKIKKSIHL